MLSIYNGSDKPVTISCDDKKIKLGLGMTPYIIPMPSKLSGTQFSNVDTSAYKTIIICQPKEGYFTVAGDEYRVGDKVDNGVLFIVGNSLYTMKDGTLQLIHKELRSPESSSRMIIILMILIIVGVVVLFILANKFRR